MDTETVEMISPQGERKTVPADSQELVRMMVKGWRQAPAQPVQTSAQEGK